MIPVVQDFLIPTERNPATARWAGVVHQEGHAMSAVLPRVPGHRPRRHTRPRSERAGRSLPSDWNPLAVALHDFRTPLTVIATAAELLQSRLEQEGTSEEVVLVQRIRRNTSWLASLLDNLAVDMELSANGLLLDWGDVDLRECLEASLGIVQTVLEQRQQRVHWSKDAVRSVHGDRRQIGNRRQIRDHRHVARRCLREIGRATAAVVGEVGRVAAVASRAADGEIDARPKGVIDSVLRHRTTCSDENGGQRTNFHGVLLPLNICCGGA